MKMSKSINDYKEAMDNIKISESFYKRTETLLTELPEVKIEKRPVINGRRISVIIMSAAACVICLFGVKLAVDGRQASIITEMVADMDGGEADTFIEIDNGADELIDDFGEYDDAGIIAESIEPDGIAVVQEQDAPDDGETIAANPATSHETETAPTGTAPVSTQSKTTAAAVTTASEQTVPLPSSKNTGAAGGIGTENDEIPIMVDTDEPAEAETESAKLFSELSPDNITVDITPYFNMGSIKSGEGTLKKSGTEFKPVLDLISNMESSATKISNISFTSLFSIMIYDENIDLEFYSIYLTNQESIVITKHSPDGSQVRETYGLRKEYYEDIRHQLFMLFGTEDDYELFLNLIGGK